MSSTQYIKFFNDTVLKQSILQGYESERTNELLGKFTMGELAFTRDTGRVFVGTYTDNQKEDDLPNFPGGILVGNRYFGMDTEDGDMFIPKYNNNNKKYDGDYSFDKDSCSLIIYDNSEKSVENEVLRNDGTIRIPIYITDDETIKSNTINGVNVLSISDDYLNVISPSEFSMTENSTCKLPPSVKFGEITTNLNIIDEESGYYNLKYNSTEKTLSLAATPSQNKIQIESGDGITIQETTTDGVTNYKIKWNPPSNVTSNATSAISVSDEIQDLYTGSIQLSTVNYLKKTESLPLSNNTIDKTLDDLSFIPSHANSIILQITTSKDNITRIRHMKSTGVLLSQVPANSEQQIYTLEVPFIIEQINENGEPSSKRLSIHATGSPTIKVLGYRI